MQEKINLKAKICVVCQANPIGNPRPKRAILALLGAGCEVSVVGMDAEPFPGAVETFSFPDITPRTEKEDKELLVDIENKNYEKLLRLPNREMVLDFLQKREFDLILCHDILLLPFALWGKKNAKVVFDAREYYPKTQEDKRFVERYFEYFNWLCREFMPQCDLCYTVSDGFAEEYYKNFNVKCEVITSAARFWREDEIKNKLDSMNLPQPSKNKKNSKEKIKMIHHGVASRTRKLENMIQAADLLDDRFGLDLMLVCTYERDYYEELISLASKSKNTKIIPPVKLEEIVPFCSSYDIGFCYLEPNTFNLLHCLPNKFFEFIQARLALVISPNPQMAKLVKQYNLGIIPQDYTIQSMANAINALSIEQIEQFSANSAKAAKELNSEIEGEKFLKILKEVI